MNLRILLLSLIFLLLPLAGARPAQSDLQILHAFGESLLAKAPPEIQNGSKLVKARYAFAAYCHALDEAKAPVSETVWGRLEQLIGHGDWERLTCGDHVRNLAEVFSGMGIPSKQVLYMQADSDYWVTTLNSNHGAVVLVDGDTSYVFDAWKLATSAKPEGQEGGPYANADQSAWNGMKLEEWERRMKRDRYVKFSLDGGTSYYPGALAAIQAYSGAGTVKSLPAKGTYSGLMVWDSGQQARLRLGVRENAQGWLVEFYYPQIAPVLVNTSTGGFEFDDEKYHYRGRVGGSGVVTGTILAGDQKVGTFHATLER